MCDVVLPLQGTVAGLVCMKTPLAFLTLYALLTWAGNYLLLQCCSDDDVLLDELDLSEEEGEDGESEKRREARQQLRKEAQVASIL